MAPIAAALLAATAILSSFTPTLAIPEPNTVGFSFSKRHVDARKAAHLARRQAKGTVQAGLDNALVLYLINVTVGTPPQPFSLQLDTGSSDIWFPTKDADVCQQSAQDCPLGIYDAASSSTLVVDQNLPPFQIEYVDGTKISGQYISDVLNIGSTQLTNMTMAAATRLNAEGIGIMGIGFDFGESGVQTANFQYPNVIDVLQAEGFINRRAYSLWLDDIESLTGSILFGGVDTDKYHGNLVGLPIQPDSRTNQIESFSVAWTGLTITGSGNNADMSPQQPTAAILDSGSTIMLLPDEIANNILQGVGAVTDPTYGAVVPCGLADDDLTFSFTFGGQGGAMVNISIAEFLTPITFQDGSTAQLDNGKEACSFGVQAANGNPVILGDTFLRSAYVVYDLENRVIGLAQTNFDANRGAGNVQAFASGSGGIPGVSSTATVAATQTFSGIPRVTQGGTDAAGTVQASAGSPTFQLTATGSVGSSATSGAANPGMKPAVVEIQGLVAVGLVFVSFIFGGGLLLL